MKKFFTVLTIAFAVAVFIPAMTCEAYPASVTQLKYIIGNWYDSKGNLVLTISNDYKINGCAVMSVDFVGDMAGMYKIKIDEGNQYRTIELVHWNSCNSAGHEMLFLNDKKALRKTKEPRYFESVGGIYIDMGQDEVLRLYGQPSSIEDKVGAYVWKYNKEGFDIRVSGGVVLEITIYKYGDRRFDWSGLSANNSKADFAYKYNTSIGRSGGLDIGHGEAIYIHDNNVVLTVFTSGRL